jgi:hypothetical protein
MSDPFEDVFMLEQTAFQQGLQKGRELAQEAIRKKSYDEGKKQGYYVGAEMAFYKEYVRLLRSRQELLTDRILKQIDILEQLSVWNSGEEPDTIRGKIQQMRTAFKHLKALLGIKPTTTEHASF